MEENLKKSLMEGEELLWSGKPETCEALDKTHKAKFVKKTVTAAVVAVVLCALYIILASYAETQVSWIVVVIILLCAYIVPHNMVKDAKTCNTKLLYGVTSERLITVSDSVKSVSYSQIREAAFRTDDDGHTSLLCGHDALNSEPANWRFAAVNGLVMNETNDFCESYAFYALPEADKVREIVRKYLKLVD